MPPAPPGDWAGRVGAGECIPGRIMPDPLEGDGLESGRWYELPPPPLPTLPPLEPLPPPPELPPTDPEPLPVETAPLPDPRSAGECPGPPKLSDGLPAPPSEGGREP